MKPLLKSLSSVLGLTILTLTLANSWAESTSELVGGSDSSLRFSDNVKDFGFSLGYYHLVAPDAGIQIGFEETYAYHSLSGGVNASNWVAMVETRFNIMPGADLSNKVFLGTGVGLTKSLLTSGTYGVKFTWDATVGKRFALSERVTYTPTISYRAVQSLGATWIIRPVAFSVFLF